MFPLPTQISALQLILAIILAVAAILLAIILKKSKSLDELKNKYSKRELNLNRKLYETAVLKNKLEVIVDGMTEGVFMLDKDFKLLVVNPACRMLLGLSKQKKLTIFDLVRGFNKFYPIEETISHVFETGERKRVSEIRVGEKFLQITVIPVEVAEGVPGVGVLLHDQTEEQRLRHKHEEFMAMMIHELRSPLTVIKGMAELLQKQLAKISAKKRDELLNQITDSSIQLLDIVNELLEDTKSDTNKFEISKEKGDINKLLEREAANYKNLANDRKINLKLDLDETIPEFNFDGTKITQVMNNLLSNAIKFTREGGIVIKSIMDLNQAKIIIEDTGVGIPDDKKPLLFKKFVQLHNDSVKSGPGTGLGLVISKGIVESHGGTIWVEDNTPTGSKLVFTLPL